MRLRRADENGDQASPHHEPPDAAASAPSVIWMPISRVRRAMPYQTTANSPIDDRTSATSAKAASRHDAECREERVATGARTARSASLPFVTLTLPAPSETPSASTVCIEASVAGDPQGSAT